MGVVKLTQIQKNEIVAKRAAGAKIMDLANEYHVSKTFISDLCRVESEEYAEIRKTAEKIKNEELQKTYATMREYFAEGRQTAQGLIARLLNIPQELIDGSSLRDRVGAAHYIKDMFADPDIELGGDKVSVVINLADTSEKESGANE